MSNVKFHGIFNNSHQFSLRSTVSTLYTVRYISECFFRKTIVLQWKLINLLVCGCVCTLQLYMFSFSLCLVSLPCYFRSLTPWSIRCYWSVNTTTLMYTGPVVSNSGKNIAKPFDVTVTKTRKNKIARGKKAKAKLVNENKMRKNKETCLKREATYKSYFDCRWYLSKFRLIQDSLFIISTFDSRVKIACSC